MQAKRMKPIGPSFHASTTELLDWVAAVTKREILGIDDIRDGTALLQVMHAFNPVAVRGTAIYENPTMDWEMERNYQVLQRGFERTPETAAIRVNVPAAIADSPSHRLTILQMLYATLGPPGGFTSDFRRRSRSPAPDITASWKPPRRSHARPTAASRASAGWTPGLSRPPSAQSSASSRARLPSKPGAAGRASYPNPATRREARHPAVPTRAPWNSSTAVRPASAWGPGAAPMRHSVDVGPSTASDSLAFARGKQGARVGASVGAVPLDSLFGQDVRNSRGPVRFRRPRPPSGSGAADAAKGHLEDGWRPTMTASRGTTSKEAASRSPKRAAAVDATDVARGGGGKGAAQPDKKAGHGRTRSRPLTFKQLESLHKTPRREFGADGGSRAAQGRRGTGAAPGDPRREARDAAFEAAGAAVELLYRCVPTITVLDEDVQDDGREEYQSRMRMVAALLVSAAHLLEDLLSAQGGPPLTQEQAAHLRRWLRERRQIEAVFLDYCNAKALAEVIARTAPWGRGGAGVASASGAADVQGAVSHDKAAEDGDAGEPARGEGDRSSAEGEAGRAVASRTGSAAGVDMGAGAGTGQREVGGEDSSEGTTGEVEAGQSAPSRRLPDASLAEQVLRAELALRATPTQQPGAEERGAGDAERAGSEAEAASGKAEALTGDGSGEVPRLSQTGTEHGQGEFDGESVLSALATIQAMRERLRDLAATPVRGTAAGEGQRVGSPGRWRVSEEVVGGAGAEGEPGAAPHTSATEVEGGGVFLGIRPAPRPTAQATSGVRDSRPAWGSPGASPGRAKSPNGAERRSTWTPAARGGARGQGRSSGGGGVADRGGSGDGGGGGEVGVGARQTWTPVEVPPYPHAKSPSITPGRRGTGRSSGGASSPTRGSPGPQRRSVSGMVVAGLAPGMDEARGRGAGVAGAGVGGEEVEAGDMMGGESGGDGGVGWLVPEDEEGRGAEISPKDGNLGRERDSAGTGGARDLAEAFGGAATVRDGSRLEDAALGMGGEGAGGAGAGRESAGGASVMGASEDGLYGQAEVDAGVDADVEEMQRLAQELRDLEGQLGALAAGASDEEDAEWDGESGGDGAGSGGGRPSASPSPDAAPPATAPPGAAWAAGDAQAEERAEERRGSSPGAQDPPGPRQNPAAGDQPRSRDGVAPGSPQRGSPSPQPNFPMRGPSLSPSLTLDSPIRVASLSRGFSAGVDSSSDVDVDADTDTHHPDTHHDHRGPRSPVRGFSLGLGTPSDTASHAGTPQRGTPSSVGEGRGQGGVGEVGEGVGAGALQGQGGRGEVGESGSAMQGRDDSARRSREAGGAEGSPAVVATTPATRPSLSEVARGAIAEALATATDAAPSPSPGAGTPFGAASSPTPRPFTFLGTGTKPMASPSPVMGADVTLGNQSPAPPHRMQSLPLLVQVPLEEMQVVVEGGEVGVESSGSADGDVSVVHVATEGGAGEARADGDEASDSSDVQGDAEGGSPAMAGSPPPQSPPMQAATTPAAVPAPSPSGPQALLSPSIAALERAANAPLSTPPPLLRTTSTSTQAAHEAPPVPQLRPRGSRKLVSRPSVVTLTRTVMVSDANEVYIGDVRSGAMDGYGVYHFSTGGVYQGEWAGGLFHGHGVEVFASGIKYYGAFISGHRTGLGRCVQLDGSRYGGEWVDGRRHGWGIQETGDGTGFWGRFDADHREGPGTLKTPSGDVFMGLFSHGELHGPGAFWSRSHQQLSIGEWRNGTHEGKGVVRSSDGQYHVCVWQPDENVYSEPAANADAIEADVLQLARANQRRGFAAAAVALKCTQPLMRAVAEGPEGVFADAALAALVAGMRATGTGEGEMERDPDLAQFSTETPPRDFAQRLDEAAESAAEAAVAALDVRSMVLRAGRGKFDKMLRKMGIEP